MSVSGHVGGKITQEAFDLIRKSARAEEAKMEKKSFVVHYTKELRFLAIALGAIVCIFMVLPFFIDPPDDKGVLIFWIVFWGGLLILLLYMVLAGVRWKIVIDDCDFIVKPAIGKAKSLHYHEISYVRETNVGGVFGVKAFDAFGRKLFSADANAAGFNPLFEKLRSLIMRDEFIVLRQPAFISILSGIFAAIVFVAAIAAWTWIYEGLNSAIMVSFVALAAIFLTFELAAFRVTLFNGFVCIRRFLRRTINIPVLQLQYGGNIIGKSGAYGGYILRDLDGWLALKVYNHYVGYAAFTRELRNFIGGI